MTRSNPSVRRNDPPGQTQFLGKIPDREPAHNSIPAGQATTKSGVVNDNPSAEIGLVVTGKGYKRTAYAVNASVQRMIDRSSIVGLLKDQGKNQFKPGDRAALETTTSNGKIHRTLVTVTKVDKNGIVTFLPEGSERAFKINSQSLTPLGENVFDRP